MAKNPTEPVDDHEQKIAALEREIKALDDALDAKDDLIRIHKQIGERREEEAIIQSIRNGLVPVEVLRSELISNQYSITHLPHGGRLVEFTTVPLNAAHPIKRALISALLDGVEAKHVSIDASGLENVGDLFEGIRGPIA